MIVTELWRYPVKSLRGEPLRSVEVGRHGIPGDRAVHVVDGAGELVTARTRPRLLAIGGSVSDDGVALVDGEPWDSEAAGRLVAEAAGDGVRLAPSSGGHRFDDTPLLVATDGAIEWMGVDGRRFRPNVVVGGVEGLAERDWPGRSLAIGDEIVVDVEKVCERCVMTTFDPDTLEQDPGVLTRINRELDGRFALNCRVATPGFATIGDEVTLD